MSDWEPHVDLMRLLEALGHEIVATTELEVRRGCAEDPPSAKLMWSAWPELQVESRSSMATTAEEVRELIDAMSGDPDVPGEAEIDAEKRHIELRGSRHLQGVEPRSRTCHKQH